MNQYQNPIELFHTILNNPRIIKSLPKELIILGLLSLCQKN